MIPGDLEHIKIRSHKIFSDFNDLIQLTTTRHGGASLPPYDTLNLGENTNDDTHLVSDNLQTFYKLFSNKYGVQKFVFPVQVHGNTVVEVNNAFIKNLKDGFISISDCDALITDIPGVFIGIRTADCVPVAVYNKKSRQLAVIHAGWRGIQNGIIIKTLQMMQVSDDAASVYCGIGPCIEADKYEVGKEVLDQINAVLPGKDVWYKEQGHLYLDLKKSAKIQLLNTGVLEKNIEICNYCTWNHDDLFYSFRKHNGQTGRFLTGMMLR